LSVVFFTDRDLGLRFPEILRAAGLSVERHRDHFAPDCADEVWLADIGARRWVAVTHDRRIRYKPNELAAIRRHSIQLLVVVGKAPFPQLAASFVNTTPKIIEFLEHHPAPVIAKVYRAPAAELLRDAGAPGRVERWFP
jgi:hypothetical protein